MHCYASVFICVYCVLTAVTLTYGIFHMYTRIHMYNNLYVKCTVLLVFFLCFYCRNMYFWYISHVYKKTHVPYFIHEMHCFASVFMCIHCVFTAETYTFLYILNIYKNTHVPYFIHEMHCFASVFICFHCVLSAETCTFGIFYMFTGIHIYHSFYMKWTVLLKFSCVFIVFLLQKHVLLKYFTIIQEYICTILHTWNALFCKCFHVFLLCLDCRNMYLCNISHVYKNKHVPYFIHEMHCFFSIFTAETCINGILYLYTRIHMYHTLYMKWTVFLVF
jgi:hypothetical protein